MFWCFASCLHGSLLSWNLFCNIFIPSSDLMNDVATLDVNDFTDRKWIFPVLLYKNIKPFT